MNFSRQALLGMGMIFGGSVMLYAMVQQIGSTSDPAPAPAVVEAPVSQPDNPAPLTTDIETEKRILAQKQAERAARVAEQEKRAREFLAQQEAAEAEALAKARLENQRYIDNTRPSSDEPEDSEAAQEQTANNEVDEAELATPVAAERPEPDVQDANVQNEQAAKKAEAAKKEEQEAAKKAEAAKNAAPKSPTDYTIKRGDGLIKLARQYNVPVKALAEANDLSPRASLQVGQTLTIPSRQQVERLEREAAAREAKRQQEAARAKKEAEARREAEQKLAAARKKVQETDAKGNFGVQVSLARNQAAADEVAKKFTSAGYQVKTSPTSRGVRVIVGPERGKVAALALKDKINTDPDVDTSGAWVLYW